MSNSNTSSNTSASSSLLKKKEVHHLEIFLIESISEFQTSVTFFLLVNENIKCG